MTSLTLREPTDPVWNINLGFVPSQHRKTIRLGAGRTSTRQDVDRMLIAQLERFTEDTRPSLAWVDSMPGPKDGELSDFFSIIHILMMSEAMRRVVEPFDLSGTQIFQTPLYLQRSNDPKQRVAWMPDESRPIPGPWHMVYTPSLKDTFVPEQSEVVSEGRHRPSGPPHNHNPASDTEPWVVALHGDAANTGPDLWREERIDRFTVFFSDRLKRAIEGSGLNVPMFPPLPCRIV